MSNDNVTVIWPKPQQEILKSEKTKLSEDGYFKCPKCGAYYNHVQEIRSEDTEKYIYVYFDVKCEPSNHPFTVQVHYGKGTVGVTTLVKP
jgi:hypothetical protein